MRDKKPQRLKEEDINNVILYKRELPREKLTLSSLANNKMKKYKKHITTYGSGIKCYS